jgi:tetratricopeptide (TPR) repeat protein
MTKINALEKYFAVLPIVVLAVLLAACQPTPSASDLPALPSLDLDGFVPPVREQIETAIAAVEADPTDATANGELGLVLGAYNFTDAALVAYRRSVMLAPKEGRWAYAYGHMLGWSGDPAGAIDVLEPALQRDRDNFWLGYELADQYLAAGRFEDSIALFKRVVAKHSDKFQSHYGLGRAQLRQGNLAQAIESLRRSADMQAQIGEIHFALGSAYRQNGDVDKAAQQFELASRFEDSKVDKFSPIMTRMAALDRGAKRHLTLARQMFEQGRYPDAIAALEEALTIDPTRQDAHAHLLLLYGRTGQMEKAMRQYDKALAANASDALLHLNMGMTLRRAGRGEQARDLLRKAIAADSELANAHAELGFVEDQLGDADAAVASLETAVQLNPNHQNAQFVLGRLLAERGEDSPALTHLEAAVVADSQATPAYLRTLAGLYTRLQRHDDAVAALRRGARLLAASGATSSRRGAALKVAIEQDLESALDAALAARQSAAGS